MMDPADHPMAKVLTQIIEAAPPDQDGCVVCQIHFVTGAIVPGALKKHEFPGIFCMATQGVPQGADGAPAGPAVTMEIVFAADKVVHFQHVLVEDMDRPQSGSGLVLPGQPH
jgi:hypothetical protein